MNLNPTEQPEPTSTTTIYDESSPAWAIAVFLVGVTVIILVVAAIAIRL